MDINDVKQKALNALAFSDWAELDTVVNQQYSPHLLNAQEWADYRSSLRKIFVYPTTDPVWPVEPVAEWSSV